MIVSRMKMEFHGAHWKTAEYNAAWESLKSAVAMRSPAMDRMQMLEQMTLGELLYFALS
jgi:hypothetical protein